MLKKTIICTNPSSNSIHYVRTLKLNIKHQHYPPHEIEESLIVYLRANTRYIASSSENPLQPQLQLLIEVEFLQVVDEADRVDPPRHFLEVSNVPEPLYSIPPQPLLVQFLPLGHPLGFANPQQQRIVHDIMPAEHIDILGDLVDECGLIGLGEVDEAVVGAEVVDILENARLRVLLLPLNSRPLHIVDLVFDLLLLEVSEGVLHHDEVDLRDAGDLDGEDTVGSREEAVLVVLHVVEVVGQDLDEPIFLLLGDGLYHYPVVVAEEEEATTRPERLLGLSDASHVLLQVQCLYDLLCREIIVFSQSLKHPVRVGCHFYVEQKADLVLRHALLFEVAADMHCFMGEAIVRLMLHCVHANHIELPLLLAELLQLLQSRLIGIHSLILHLLPLMEHPHEGALHILLVTLHHNGIAIDRLVKGRSIRLLD